MLALATVREQHALTSSTDAPTLLSHLVCVADIMIVSPVIEYHKGWQGDGNQTNRSTRARESTGISGVSVSPPGFLKVRQQVRFMGGGEAGAKVPLLFAYALQARRGGSNDDWSLVAEHPVEAIKMPYEQGTEGTKFTAKMSALSKCTAVVAVQTGWLAESNAELTLLLVDPLMLTEGPENDQTEG